MKACGGECAEPVLRPAKRECQNFAPSRDDAGLPRYPLSFRGAAHLLSAARRRFKNSTIRRATAASVQFLVVELHALLGLALERFPDAEQPVP